MNLPSYVVLMTLFVSVHSVAYVQGVLREGEKQFIEALVSDGEGLERFVDKEEIQLAHRLGIQYTGVDDKWLIGFDFDPNIKKSSVQANWNTQRPSKLLRMDSEE